MPSNQSARALLFCSLAVTMNVVLSEAVVLLSIPFLFLDAVGTIFVAANFDMRYGILTGLCTNLLTGLLTSPLAFPYVIVNIFIAIVVNLLTKKGLSYGKAFFVGIIVALSSSLVSTPITMFLFGGMTNSVVDVMIFSLRSTGRSLFTSAYWGTAARAIVDKVLSCFFVVYLSNQTQIQRYLPEMNH